MLLERSAARHVLLVPGRGFTTKFDVPCQYMRASYSTVTPEQMDKVLFSALLLLLMIRYESLDEILFSANETVQNHVELFFCLDLTFFFFIFQAFRILAEVIREEMQQPQPRDS